MKRSASEALYDRLSERIQNGEYAVGQRMPTEQSLCASLGVGRSTVREAMRALQAQGYVTIRRGSGAYVISQTGNRGEFISQWMGENRDSMSDYMVVRIAVESLALRLFLKRFTQEEMDRLNRLEATFEEAIRAQDTQRIAAGDEMLHAALLRASGNRCLQVVGRQLTEAFREYRYVAFEQREFFDAAIREHRAILEALGRRDSDDAVFCLRKHLETSLVNTFGAFEE